MVALEVVVVLLQLSREGKPHPVCLPASAKLAAQGRSGQPSTTRLVHTRPPSQSGKAPFLSLC